MHLVFGIRTEGCNAIETHVCEKKKSLKNGLEEYVVRDILAIVIYKP